MISIAKEREALLRLASSWERKIARSLLNAFSELKTRVQIQATRRLIEEQGMTGVLYALRDLNIEGVIGRHVLDDLEDAVNTSGRMAVSVAQENNLLISGFRFDRLSFLGYSISTVNAGMVSAISEQTQKAIEEAVRAGINSGRNPLSTARDFRSTIGLSHRQATAVKNYRSYLESLDSAALGRTLRDRRFDAMIQRAIDSGGRLPTSRIDQLVQRYRERSIAYRARTIARTESLRAVNAGKHLSYLQMQKEGVLETTARKYWVYTYDNRTRDAHKAVPELNPEGVPMDGVFHTPLGPMLYPHDPNGSAGNTVNCRCTFSVRPKTE